MKAGSEVFTKEVEELVIKEAKKLLQVNAEVAKFSNANEPFYRLGCLIGRISAVHADS